jgi:hypothetical protein
MSARRVPPSPLPAEPCFRRFPGSRSNWAKDSSTLSTRRPIDVPVLDRCVTDTKATRCQSNVSISRAKSRSDRLSRSTL